MIALLNSTCWPLTPQWQFLLTTLFQFHLTFAKKSFWYHYFISNFSFTSCFCSCIFFLPLSGSWNYLDFNAQSKIFWKLLCSFHQITSCTTLETLHKIPLPPTSFSPFAALCCVFVTVFWASPKTNQWYSKLTTVPHTACCGRQHYCWGTPLQAKMLILVNY
jgi:hypothetical protein